MIQPGHFVECLFVLIVCDHFIANSRLNLRNIQNTGARDKLVIDDQAGLNVAHDGIQLVIILDNVFLPDAVVNGVVLRQIVEFLEVVGVAVRHDEIQRSAVFNCLQHCIVGVTLHVDGRAGELNVAVQDHTNERNGVTRLHKARGIQCNVEQVIRILIRICVTAVRHQSCHSLLGGERIQSFLDEGLVVLTVVRLVFIKVGIQVGTHRRGRNTERTVIQIFVVCDQQLVVEAIDIRGRKCEVVVGDPGLVGCRILLLRCITVIDGTNNVALESHTVKHGRVQHVQQFKLGIKRQIAFTLVDLLCLFKQCDHTVLAADCLFPLDLGGNDGVHTAVGKAGQTEVDVVDTFRGKLIVHRCNVLEGRQRLIYRYGERHDLLRDLDHTKSFDVKRNILLQVLFRQTSQDLLLRQIVGISLSHADVACLIIVAAFGIAGLRCQGLIAEHDVTDLEVAGVLTVRNDGLRLRTGNRERVKLVGVLRTRVERRHNGVILTLRACMVSGQLTERFTLLDHCEVTIALRNEFDLAVRAEFVLFQLIFQHFCQLGNVLFLVSQRNILVNILIHGRTQNRQCDLVDRFLGYFFTRLLIYDHLRRGVGVEAVVGLNTEDGHTQCLLILTRDAVVRKVVTIDHTGETGGLLAVQILEAEQRTRTVGIEGVTGIVTVTGAHVRQNIDVLDGIQRGVVTKTVGRLTNGKAVLVEGILKCQLKYGRQLVLCLVTGFFVVCVHLVERILGITLDQLLQEVDINGRCRRIQVVEDVFEGTVRVLFTQFGVTLDHGLQRFIGLYIVGVLFFIEGREAVEVMLAADCLLQRSNQVFLVALL